MKSATHGIVTSFVLKCIVTMLWFKIFLLITCSFIQPPFLRAKLTVIHILKCALPKVFTHWFSPIYKSKVTQGYHYLSVCFFTKLISRRQSASTIPESQSLIRRVILTASVVHTLILTCGHFNHTLNSQKSHRG